MTRTMMAMRRASVRSALAGCMTNSIRPECYNRPASRPRPASRGRSRMALYIMLSTLSERGRQVVKKLPGSIRKVNQEVGRMGVRVLAQYAVLGPYDFVTVI